MSSNQLSGHPGRILGTDLKYAKFAMLARHMAGVEKMRTTAKVAPQNVTTGVEQKLWCTASVG